MSKLNILVILWFCLASVSCKQSLFLKRKYTDGFFFSKGTTVQLKNIHSQKMKNDGGAIAMSIVSKPNLPPADTIFTTSGKRIPCKVKAITQKIIVYSEEPDYSKDIRTYKVASIHFNGRQREYLTERNEDANPLLQYGIFDQNSSNAKPRKAGLAIFGYVPMLITGVVLLASVPLLGGLFTLLSLSLLIVVSVADTSSDGYKTARAIGRFLGILYITVAALLLAILVIAVIAFA